ncbi:hypothetical protein [Streptomyces seoulensis]|uniref:hypothetical protein n=1 Tax=Streptomyces seoulensis TaxID=73044 RepID=UPI0004CD5AA4|nr:hypothetical protein [Streptomyces seoulensis]
MRRRPAGTAARGTLTGGSGRTATGAARGRWLTLGRDGRLSLYAPARDGLLRWTETTPGGPGWSGPHHAAVAGLTHLSVTQGANGYVHFLGRRERAAADGARNVDIVHATQYQTGLAVTDWRSLGSPHPDRAESARLGPPCGAVASDGTVHVFVRGARGGLLLRREDSKGQWRGWEDLGGAGVDALPATVALSGGRIEVCAAAETGAFVWLQSRPGGDFSAPRGFSLRPRPGTVSALETSPDRAAFLWTDAESGEAHAWRPGGSPVGLGGAGADQPYAAVRTSLDGGDWTVLATRDATGSAVLGMGMTGQEADGFWWHALAASCQGAPTLALDGRGRVAVALVGADGVPMVARQEDGRAGLVLTDWQRL